jgi:sentrin-specific protease 1
VRSSTPYPISLSVRKLQKILDVCEPMNPDVFNMVVRILAPKSLEKSKCQRKTIRKYYMDMQFNICHYMFLLHNFVCY